MKRLLSLGISTFLLVLAGCGGSGDTITSPPQDQGGGATGVASVQVTASSPQLNSSADGSTEIQIFALVRDAGNAILSGIPTSFQTSSGSITVTQAQTDDTGTAIATLTNGNDPSNRQITVTVTAESVQGTVTIDVVGTTLTISGPPALALNDSANYTISLLDSQGAALAGRTIAVSSSNGNTLSSASLTTDTTGTATLQVTAAASGNDTISATALGLTATQDIAISSDVFVLQAPADGQEIPLGTDETVTVQWTKAGVPQNGEVINFTSTRGTLSSSTAVTNAAGEATVTVNSNSAGPATISASNDEGTSTSVGVEFIATTAVAVDLQANPNTVPVNGQSTITATVRDSNNNQVKNKVVVFVIDQDSTGNSFLSVGSDLTDSQGRAQTVYTAGGVPSAANGVTIRAFVQDTPAVEDTVPLTVAGRAVDISIGTGDELFEPTPALYSQEWAIIVTDTSGTAPTPVANSDVQASIRSLRFYKGELVLQAIGSDFDWVRADTATCLDEDTNQDGFLDLVTEDIDMDRVLEAGNRATLAALPPGAPEEACGSINGLGGPTTTVETDGNGIARVCVIYLQSDNLWVDVEIGAQLSVFGTEYLETQDFVLLALASDLEDENSNPAGQFSPFGQVGDCADPN